MVAPPRRDCADACPLLPLWCSSSPQAKRGTGVCYLAAGIHDRLDLSANGSRSFTRFSGRRHCCRDSCERGPSFPSTSARSSEATWAVQRHLGARESRCPRAAAVSCSCSRLDGVQSALSPSSFASLFPDDPNRMQGESVRLPCAREVVRPSVSSPFRRRDGRAGSRGSAASSIVARAEESRAVHGRGPREAQAPCPRAAFYAVSTTERCYIPMALRSLLQAAAGLLQRLGADGGFFLF